MTLRAEFATLPSDFDAFLFASIGEAVSGAPVSVMSALVRVGSDPWAEAERLSRMRRDAAVDALAIVISTLNGGWAAADVRNIAARLVELLPDAEPQARSRLVTATIGEPAKFNWSMVLIALVGAACLVWTLTGFGG